jgi:hypothetical protein
MRNILVIASLIAAGCQYTPADVPDETVADAVVEHEIVLTGQSGVEFKVNNGGSISNSPDLCAIAYEAGGWLAPELAEGGCADCDAYYTFSLGDEDNDCDFGIANVVSIGLADLENYPDSGSGTLRGWLEDNGATRFAYVDWYPLGRTAWRPVLGLWDSADSPFECEGDMCFQSLWYGTQEWWGQWTMELDEP